MTHTAPSSCSTWISDIQQEEEASYQCQTTLLIARTIYKQEHAYLSSSKDACLPILEDRSLPKPYAATEERSRAKLKEAKVFSKLASFAQNKHP